MTKRTSEKNGVAYTPEVRQMVKDRIKAGESKRTVATDMGVSLGSIRNWLGKPAKKQARTPVAARRRRSGEVTADPGRIGGLVSLVRAELAEARKVVERLERSLDALDAPLTR